MQQTLRNLTMVFLALFAGVWLLLSWWLLSFKPTDSTPILDVGTFRVALAGFLATAVGSATATALGIEIQKVKGNGTVSTLNAFGQALGSDRMIQAGIYTYALIGVIVLLLTFGRSRVAPELFETFSLSVIGWFAGAFTAVFRAD